MKVPTILLILIVLGFGKIDFTIAQGTEIKNQSFAQKDFERFKLDQSIYNFWWYKNKWFPDHDTLPYFVDDRQYKGILNYGIEITRIDKGNTSFIENIEMYYLNVQIDNCIFNQNNNVIEIQGIVRGGWSDHSGEELTRKKNNVDIFIGQRKDTISYLYNPVRLVSPEENIVKYKGKVIATETVLDSFPSFYMHNYTHYRTDDGNNRKFKIKSKIDKNSILVFGLDYCYAEIFDIGNLVFSNGMAKGSKAIKSDPKADFKVVIRNNVQVLNKESPADPGIKEYYLTTKKAEDYILLKQYGKAKKEYDELLRNNRYVFARDIHNAIRCAILTRDVKTAILWCERMALKGLDLKYFDAKIFDQIKKNDAWQEFLNKYPSLYNKHKDGLNEYLINNLNELVVIDQRDYVKHSKGEVKNSELRKTTEFVDGKFIDLIEKEGFPTEEKIGIKLLKDGLIQPNPDYFVLIIHSYQMQSSRHPEIEKIITEGAKNFEYDAYRDDLEIFKASGNTCLQIYKGKLYNDRTCNLNERQVKRIAFGFGNEHGFIVEKGEYIVIPYNYENELEDEKFIEERFDFVTKLTDDWFFYEK